eukprot:ctg_1620.g305
MVMDRLSQRDCRLYGWVLDGFPRTRAQVQALRRLDDAASGGATAATAPDPLRTVVVLEADARQLYERLSHRRIDPETHAVYNMKTYPPAEEEVRERLLRLAVEDEPVFAQRLQQYRKSLQEVLREIDPSGTGDCLFAERADDGRRLIAVDVTQLGVRAAFQAVVDRLWQLRQVHLPPPQSTPSGNGDDPSAKRRTAMMGLETVPADGDSEDESRPRRLVPQPVDWGATRTQDTTAPVGHDALSAATSTPTPNMDGATTTAPPAAQPAPARNDCARDGAPGQHHLSRQRHRAGDAAVESTSTHRAVAGEKGRPPHRHRQASGAAFARHRTAAGVRGAVDADRAVRAGHLRGFVHHRRPAAPLDGFRGVSRRRRPHPARLEPVQIGGAAARVVQPGIARFPDALRVVHLPGRHSHHAAPRRHAVVAHAVAGARAPPQWRYRARVPRAQRGGGGPRRLTVPLSAGLLLG